MWDPRRQRHAGFAKVLEESLRGYYESVKDLQRFPKSTIHDILQKNFVWQWDWKCQELESRKARSTK